MTPHQELDLAKASIARLEARIREREQRDLKRLLRWAQRTSVLLDQAEREMGEMGGAP